MRILIATVATAIICGALASCGGSSNPQPTPSQAVVSSYDGQNPGPSCGANGQITNKYVPTVASADVRMAGGKVFGRLLLRHSTICQTAWGEVFYDDSRPAPPGFKITVIVVRPHGLRPSMIPFTTTDFVSPAFTSMLSNNGAEYGCVYASARVSIAGRTGPTATTSCRAS